MPLITVNNLNYPTLKLDFIIILSENYIILSNLSLIKLNRLLLHTVYLADNMFYFILSLLISFLVPLFIYFVRKEAVLPKIFKVYSQPGKWFYLKFVVMYIILCLRKLKSLKESSNKTNKEAFMESMKPLSDNDKAFDATFFQAVNQEGFYIVGGLEKRHQAKFNGLLYVLVPGLGLLESEKLPKTSLNANPKALLSSINEYSAEGLSFAPVIPMKEWRLKFEGPMKLFPECRQFFNVKLDAKWTSDLPYFNLETDIDRIALAKAVATEKWSKEFFKNSKENHQSHYEQMGYLSVEMTIDDELFKVEMDAFRDHSFGHKRDWTCLHRYAFFMLYLIDNTRISIGAACQYNTVSNLLIGYIVLPNKQLHAIRSSDLKLYHHGEKGTPEKNVSFTFTAAGKTYVVKTILIAESFHYKGNDIEAKLYERFLDCEVNGIKGKGVSEWQYNNSTL